MALTCSTRPTLHSQQSVLARLKSAEASQIVEFAVTLPLLMVFLIGITDFGGAFTLKQKLNNAVREGARFGANEPSSDLDGTEPVSVDAIANLVGHYLQSARVNDCGISDPARTVNKSTSAPLTWTYTANTGCAGTLTLTIERGYPVQLQVGTPNYWLIATRVTISYPYQWRFNRVIPLLVPGTNYGLSQIPTEAVVPNLT